MSINLQPFYEAVALYALDRWLPLATGAMVLAIGLLIVIQAAGSRKNDWLSMLTGLLAAFTLPATALSILALLHTRGALWNEQLQVAVVKEPTHWWFALALAGSILLAMIFAGLRRSSSLGTAAGVLLGLTLALQIPLFIAGYVLTRYYWWPLWTNFLYYAVPIAATVVVAISTGCYMVRRVAPAARGLNAFYQGVTLVMLAWLAYLGMGTYFNWGNWRYGAFVNSYEFYHYYIGAKYSPEVGYYHMYNATLVADAETGDPYNKTQIRNLTTGVKVNSADVLKEAETYKAMFDTPRWQEFMADIRWFKTKLVPSRFSAMIGDKGYNATPVWTMLVRGILCQNISPIETPPAIVEYPMRAYRGFMAWIFGQDIYPDTANKLPEGEPNGMLFLALLDVILIIAATAAVVWAFGIRAALLMLIVLGTSYVMKYSHMKGAFLRTDFTMSLIIGICMLKKDRYAAAGSFIAYSCLSRVFPAVFFFGIGAKLAWHGIAKVPQFLRETGAPGIAAAALAAVAGLAGGALVLGPKIIARLEAMPKAALPDTVPLDLPRWAELGLQAGFALAAAGFLVVGLVILWGWRTRNVPRRYLWFFSSATATVVILVTAAFFYHSAVKPAHHPLNYEGQFEFMLAATLTVLGALAIITLLLLLTGVLLYLFEGTKRYAKYSLYSAGVVALLCALGGGWVYRDVWPAAQKKDDADSAENPSNLSPEEAPEVLTWEFAKGNFEENFLTRFDGGLTVFGEYAQKIGKHNTDISPWRVGFKYWFIGVGSKRPLWAGWTRAEKGETQWLEGGLATPNPDAPFLDGLMKELRGPNEAVRATAEFEKMRNSGSFERIRFRDPDTGFWEALWTEFKDNKVITRSGIHRTEKHGIYNLILILVLALSFFLVPAFKDHEATAWSFVVVFFLVSATYYYFIMLLVPLLFFSPYASRPTRALGVMALLMAAWVGYALYTPPVNWKQEFSQYYYHSVMYFVIVLYMMLLGAGASLRLLWRNLRRTGQQSVAAS